MICELYENKTKSYELLRIGSFESCVTKAVNTDFNRIRLYHVKVYEENKFIVVIGLTLFYDDDGNKILYVYDCTPEQSPQLLLILSPGQIGVQRIIDRPMYNILHTIIVHWKE